MDNKINYYLIERCSDPDYWYSRFMGLIVLASEKEYRGYLVDLDGFAIFKKDVRRIKEIELDLYSMNYII